MTPHDEDNLMDRFDRDGLRRYRARDAIIVVLLACAVLLVAEGSAVRKAGGQIGPGVQHDVVTAVGGPAGSVSDALGVHHVVASLTAPLSPDPKLAAGGGFGADTPATAAPGAVSPVTAHQFDPAVVGDPPPPRRRLRTLLVTGDSLSTPLDLEVARRLAPRGVKVLRDPHLGTGISKTELVDWGRLSRTQVAADRPDAVIVFIGANEGFPMPAPGGGQAPCCGGPWSAIYANRARAMMDTYRQAGAAHVYWLTVPTPQEPARAAIERSVNAAIGVAAQPWRDEVEVLDTVALFTPGERYRSSMTVSGRSELVRESDGIHLNEAGSGLLADTLLSLVGHAYAYG